MRLRDARFAVLPLAAGALLLSCDSSTDSGSAAGPADTTRAPVPTEPVRSSAPWNASVAYGTLTDARDGQIYRTVTIGTQTWMAENLAWDTADGKGSWCWHNRADSCRIFGRYYLDGYVRAGSVGSSAVPSGLRGVCPAGWHLPSRGEWSILVRATGDSSRVGALLRARDAGWRSWDSVGQPQDTFGFRMLPAGEYTGFTGVFDTSHFVDSGRAANFHLSEVNARWKDGHHAYIHYSSDAFDYFESNSTGDGYNVRCVKD